LLFDRLRLGGAGKKRHRKPVHNLFLARFGQKSTAERH
jgi:hypothetical protein